MDKISSKYFISVDNLNIEPVDKTKIILGNTGLYFSEHLEKIYGRKYGYFNRCPTFTIGMKGKIYQHYSPVFYSNFVQDRSIDRESISISLVNLGWFRELDGDLFDWRGRKFTGRYFQREWKGKKYWHPYPNHQILALIELIDYLCDVFTIERKFINTNLSVEEAIDYSGIVCRSNFNKHFYDPSPAFNFKLVNKKINEYA